MLPLLTPALEAFIKLLGGIASLEKTKLQNRQILFNEVVKPLFEELEPVALNYKDIFRKARQVAAIGSSRKLQESLSLILEERQVMDMARIKVHEMAIQVSERIKDDEIVSFANAVNNYFYGATSTYDYSRTIALLHHIEHEKQKAKTTVSIRKIEKDIIIRNIDYVLSDLEQSWKTIVKLYEKLKINSVSPKEFIKRLPN